MTDEAKRIKKYHDSKYVSDNPDKFDPRDVTRARGFIEGVETGIAIAEKAVGEITTGRTDMAYVVCDIYEQCGEEILSRIKTEIGGEVMEETPISDKNNLSVDSYGTGFLENFIYGIGLLLDSEIPVYGFTNPQRIEIAVNRYISQSARIRELEGALEAVNTDMERHHPAISTRTWHKVKNALNKKEQS